MTPRVCHLTSVHPPDDVRILYKECVGLAKKGFDVHLVAPFAGPGYIRQGVFIHSVPPAASRLVRMTQTALSVIRMARSLKADLYHLHDPELLPFLFALPWGKPIIFDVHEHVVLQILNKDWLAAKKLVALMYTAIEKICATGRVRLVLAEESYLEAYRKIDPHATVVLNYPLPINTLPTSRSNSVPKPERLICVGGVSLSRGIDETLMALRILHDSGHLIHFDCVGAFSSKDESYRWIQRAHQLGVQKYVSFHGRLDHPKAMEIMAGASIGLCLLHPIPNYLNSYPTKIFEYMQLGLPFILSDFPLYRECFGPLNCCVFSDPRNPHQVAEAIKYLLRNPAQSLQMGNRGYAAMLNKYSWLTQESKLLALYKECLSISDLANY